MARSSSTILKNFSGGIGKEIVIKQYGDKTVISKYPDMSNRKLSPKQQENNLLMAEANYAAREIIADPALRDAEQVRLNVTRNMLYRALVRDFYKKAKEAKEVKEIK